MTTTDYSEFLALKAPRMKPSGFLVSDTQISHVLFEFQRDIVRWALRLGKSSIFLDCGLGKTPIQLAWAHHVHAHTRLPVLILAPLAVTGQTVAEGDKFGVDVHYTRSGDDLIDGVNITNYEMLEHFDPSTFGGVVLDESSILKSYDGSTRTRIIESFADTSYRLACTATPAPNDYMELGNHSEFVGSMSRTEMLAMFFVHDGGETQKWRLKGHAMGDFWQWVCSWAVAARRPSDLGYDDSGFKLPPLDMFEHVVAVDPMDTGVLFDHGNPSLIERRRARKLSIGGRVDLASDMVSTDDEQWIVWCGLNDESKRLTAAIDGAVEITGSDSPDHKESSLLGFGAGKHRVIVTKPSIAGFGMNFQSCRNMVFVGLSDSYEEMYQAVRRCYRFGQKRTVNVHIVTASTDGAVVANVKRKEQDASAMAHAMAESMGTINADDIHEGTRTVKTEYTTDTTDGEGWKMILGDCIPAVEAMDEGSIDFSVFSPPFASLYTYSNSDRDMGNCDNHDEFSRHFAYLIDQLFRVTKPGRLVSFHCMNLPTSKVRDGVIGLRDFRGELIRSFSDAGWIYHSEVCIWKDPVTAMQRTKALGLLHKQIRKDSCMSRQGIPDYLVTMRKPGVNPSPVSHTSDEFPVKDWQGLASPIWMDINPSDTIQFRAGREEEDERHICPLQLEVIRRALRLWSKPGDLVLSPFAGVGSEGFVCVEMDRRFVGVELKRSYYDQACKNMLAAEHNRSQASMF